MRLCEYVRLGKGRLKLDKRKAIEISTNRFNF